VWRFPKENPVDTSQCTGPSGTPISHENAKKHPGADSLRSLARCSMIRSEIPCGKTDLSLDLRILAVCEGGIVKLQILPSNSEIREHTALLHYYMSKFRRGPREVGTEKFWKFRLNMMGIIMITESQQNKTNTCRYLYCCQSYNFGHNW
jgi:hypothetical protein